MTKHSRIRFVIPVLALFMASCASTDVNIDRFERAVTAVPSGETASVPALTLARALTEAGFSRQEILEYGPEIRNALARSGGAQVRVTGKTLALISVLEQRLYIVTNEAGTIVVPVSSGT